MIAVIAGGRDYTEFAVASVRCCARSENWKPRPPYPQTLAQEKTT